MSENRKNPGSQEKDLRGGRTNEELKNSRKNVANPQKKGADRSEDVDRDESLERASERGTRENVRTGKDLQEGSSSGRSGSLSKEEQDRRNRNQGKR